jgi:hypothetical protein
MSAVMEELWTMSTKELDRAQSPAIEAPMDSEVATVQCDELGTPKATREAQQQ